MIRFYLEFSLYDKPTVSELFSFILNKNGKPEAERSSHDDLVMSLALAWQLYRTEQKIQKTNYAETIKQLPREQMFDSNGLY